MPPFASPNSYTHHRFPAEIISHGVWLNYRFCLSYRDVEALLFARRIMLTYEAIRKWCRKFGQAYANQLRRRRPQRGDKWPLDEVFLTIRGEQHDLWRAVDEDGHVLDRWQWRRHAKMHEHPLTSRPSASGAIKPRLGPPRSCWLCTRS